MKILLVVDMQNDFIDGVFGTEEAIEILPKVIEYVKNFDGMIVATKDTHFLSMLRYTIEEQKLQNHCICGSGGHDIPSDLEKVLYNKAMILSKTTFGRLDLYKCLKGFYEKDDNPDIYICGLCTDICVLNNALILRNGLPYTRIRVLSDLCAGTTPENHQKALDLMKINLIEVGESKEVING